MKCSREYKRWINRLRKKYGKKNGVIKEALIDHPVMDKKHTSLKGRGEL